MEDASNLHKQQRTFSPRATLGIYTHRHSDYLSKLLFSIGKMTKESVDIRLMIEPGNVHENMLRVAQDVQTEYFIWMDEDTQILTDDWLKPLLEQFRNPDIGLVCCLQVKDENMIDRTLGRSKQVTGGYVGLSWAPGHLFAIRTSLLRTVVPDTQIPGVKGMSDLDICLQVRAAGFKVVNDERVVVWHPHKPSEDTLRRADGQPTLQEEKDVFEAQKNYMLSKWGEFYVDALREQVLEVELEF